MKNARAQSQLTHHLETGLGKALRGMTGVAFTIAERERAAEAESDGSFLWQQSFGTVPAPAFWISTGKTTWEALGSATLVAAGIDSPSPEDCRSTWQEILSQTMAGVASGITADMEREITAGQGEEVQAEPPNLVWIGFSIIDAENKTWPFKVAWSQELANLYEARAQETQTPAGRENTVSKTFDLLLDVALPVSVSFGRTSLQIREVLKLNTGSIVELDRFVSDPVEVIVNDCVIGHGEVVVVDGNYGVRINQLASRADRLRTGMTEPLKAGARQ